MLKEFIIKLLQKIEKNIQYLNGNCSEVLLAASSGNLTRMDDHHQHHERLLSLLNLTEEDMDYILNMSLNLRNMNNVDMNPQCYCSGRVRDIATGYRQIHGYLSLVVCLFGTIANVLNVVVLTRKELAAAPINRILTGIAVADMLVMLEYVPFACYMYLMLPGAVDFSYTGAVFILFHMHFSQVLHTISICLTLTLAIWRYIAIR